VVGATGIGMLTGTSPRTTVCPPIVPTLLACASIDRFPPQEQRKPIPHFDRDEQVVAMIRIAGAATADVRCANSQAGRRS